VNPTPTIKKSVVLLASVAALVAPTAATAYPVIPDDPGTAQAQAEGQQWYRDFLKHRAVRTKPSSVKPKPVWPCPGSDNGKQACPKR
jgi:hypothetical protein